MKKRLGMVDLDTGELVEGVPVWVGGKPKIHSGWFMAFQDSLVALAADPDLKGRHLRVLVYLLGHLDFDNFIQVPQTQIADALGMRKEHVSRSIKLLADKQILFRGPKLARSNSFRLNPNYGWKGKVADFREAQRSHLQLVEVDSED